VESAVTANPVSYHSTVSLIFSLSHHTPLTRRKTSTPHEESAVASQSALSISHHSTVTAQKYKRSSGCRRILLVTEDRTQSKEGVTSGKRFTLRTYEAGTQRGFKE